MDHGDAARYRLTRPGVGDRLALEADLSLVGLVDAEQHLDQSRLSCTVLTQQPEDLAFVQGQVDGVVGHHTWETLRETDGLEEYRAGHQSGSYGVPEAAGGRAATPATASTAMVSTKGIMPKNWGGMSSA